MEARSARVKGPGDEANVCSSIRCTAHIIQLEAAHLSAMEIERRSVCVRSAAFRSQEKQVFAWK